MPLFLRQLPSYSKKEPKLVNQICVSAVVIRNDAGQVLTVRKRGTHALMFPGGKPEIGENAQEAAIREFAEELGGNLDPASLRLIGEFTAPAANEQGHTVKATVFEHPFVNATSPHAEIEHVQWVDLFKDIPNLAPLLRDEVFSVLRNQPRPLLNPSSHGDVR